MRPAKGRTKLILEELRTLKESKVERRVPISIAISALNDILAKLNENTRLQNLTPAGSIRRFDETVGNINLLGTADNAEEAIREFVSFPLVEEVLEVAENRVTVLVSDGIPVDLSIVPRDSFGSALQYLTGNREHNVKLGERAARKGLSLSIHGITNLDTGKLEKYATEKAFYERQGLQYIPPEIRGGRQEIEKAERGEIPELLGLSDIKGDLHVHTTWSDGRNTVEEMVLAAKGRGYDYIGIADHSSSPRVAGGKGYREQLIEIRELNRKIDGIHILGGAEVNIMPDGSLEIADEILSEMNFVIAAVHHRLDLPRKLMTERIISAMENPYVSILAHPTSRRVLPVPQRIENGPVDADMEAIFQAAARTNTILEIDSMPSRLDLKDTYAYRARELGVKIVIDTDSHNTESLEFMNFGVRIARRAWCRASDIVNTRPLDELRTLIER